MRAMCNTLGAGAGAGAVPCAQKRLQSSTEGVVYPLQPDQREFFCIVKKVNDARNHESAAA
jgi:hypothetical protein